MLVNFCLTGIYMIARFSTLNGECIFSECKMYDLEAQRKKDEANVAGILTLINVIVLIIAKEIFLKRIINKTFGTNGTLAVTPRNYTILLKLPPEKIPRDMSQISEIIDSIVNDESKKTSGGIAKIASINLVFDTFEVSSTIKKLLEVEKKIKESVDKTKRKKKKQEKKALIATVAKYARAFQDKPLSLFTGWTFVTFQNESDVAQVLNRSRFKLTRKIKIRQAPEPSDIIWSSFNNAPSLNICIRVYIWFSLFLFIILSFLTITGFKTVESDFNLKYTDAAYWFWNFVIIAFNQQTQFMVCLIYKLVLERNKRKTYTKNLSRKFDWMLIRSFVSQTFVIVFTNAWDFNKFDLQLFGDKGIIKDVLYSMLFDLLFDIAGFTWKVASLIKRYRQRKFTRQPNDCPQFKMHEAYEGIEFSLLEEYDKIFSLTVLAFFYQFVFPYGLLFTFGWLWLLYFGYKYILANRAAIQPELSFSFTKKAVTVFEIIIVLVAGGSVFYELISHEFSSQIGWNFTALGIALFDLLIGIRRAVNFFRNKNSLGMSSTNNLTYQEMRTKFARDYDRMNPMTAGATLHEIKKGTYFNNPSSNPVNTRFAKSTGMCITGLGYQCIYDKRWLDPDSSLYIIPELMDLPRYEPMENYPLIDIRKDINWYDMVLKDGKLTVMHSITDGKIN